MPLVADYGTSWSKLLDTGTQDRKIIRTKDLADSLMAEVATGHNTISRAGKRVNELVALGQGALELVADKNFTVLDVGSRDIKFVSFENRAVREMDWSAKCGALTGFTLELMLDYFNLDSSSVAPAERAAGVTCGVLGMEEIFDAIAHGRPAEQALAEFTRGLAHNAHRFIGRPERFYLSGGMCENNLFMRSFPEAVEVIPLGRFVLVEGLIKELQSV